MRRNVVNAVSAQTSYKFVKNDKISALPYIAAMKQYLVDLHRLRHNPYNGLYVFCYELASHLVQQALHNEQLNYYVPKDNTGMFGNVPKYIVHKRSHKFFQAGTSAFDVWHLTTGISQYRPFNRKTKVVYTIHDVNFLVEDPHNKKRNLRSLKLMQKNSDRADHIVGISKYAIAFASQYLDFNDKPISVIHNGYSAREFPGFDQPRYKPEHEFYFSIGLVQPRKNFHVLPPLLEGNNRELIIAGLNHFDYASQVMEEARKWKVADRVKLVGGISDEEKYWYYKNCNAFLFPSVAEGFGMPPLEAMHFGKPVFLSKGMSLPEIGGEAAYYFDDFNPDSMKQVVEEGLKDYRSNQRDKKIREHASTFTWDRCAAQYLNVYREVLR